MAKQQAQVAAAGTQTYNDFTQLLEQEFKPKTEQAREAVEFAVKTLAEQALQQSITISDDAYKSIEAIIAQIDHKLSEQINLILHHDDFQKLESAWRGLHHLVSNTETDEKLKIRFMDVSKEELRRTMKRYKGAAWDQSPLFKQIYEEEYGQLGGEPYGCLVADYYFDHTPPDVDLLGSIAKVSAASHTPFISGASPSVLQMDSWQELANPRDLTKIFAQNLEYAPWNSMRNTEDARYVGLAMPRFLSRLPYGAKTNPVDEFDFEEETNGADHRRFAWANAAYAMGVNINRSFKLYGWCTLIRGVESGGTVENLPCHTFPTDDGGVDMKCPTEIAISDRREAELARNGFIPLIHRKNTDHATFIGAQSMQKPAEYSDADATANANLSARLPYLFACSRFAHYLTGRRIDEEHIHALIVKNALTTGAVSSVDYDYTWPRADLGAKQEDPRDTAFANQEHYVWADYAQPQAGATGLSGEHNRPKQEADFLARVRVQAFRCQGLRASGSGNLRGIVTGQTFNLTRYPQSVANREYLVVSSTLEIENVDEESQARGAADNNQRYRCVTNFVIQPANEPFRSPRTIEKPRAYGPETAVVVGPANQEIWTDACGRVKVQFAWDRIGQNDERSSCWLRVSSLWQGNDFGGTHLPRIGQEVIVDHLRGDADRPIITGRVVNAFQMPAWKLPDNQALSGFRSRELGGGRANHFLMDDTKGKIQVQLSSDHALSQLNLGSITRVTEEIPMVSGCTFFPATASVYRFRTSRHGR